MLPKLGSGAFHQIKKYLRRDIHSPQKVTIFACQPYTLCEVHSEAHNQGYGCRPKDYNEYTPCRRWSEERAEVTLAPSCVAVLSSEGK